ncbi:MAG: YkgJ family cysteine cluster protein [Phycisphaeraceae bacterium]|nr:YkgJ family cysteine cluster protein [Phycisphaeraceae bacterium]
MPQRPAHPSPADRAAAPRAAEWFASPDPDHDRPEPGLRFACTMCGNCCSGPEGYILLSDDECDALARRLNLSADDFKKRYTHRMSKGRSLNEKKTPHGLDCVFLDRDTIPGKAICGVYEDRPLQCRTWPFWPSVVKSRKAWESAKRVCPGMDHGKLFPVEHIRIQRDACDI